MSSHSPSSPQPPTGGEDEFAALLTDLLKVLPTKEALEHHEKIYRLQRTHEHERSLEVFKSVIEAGRHALKAPLFINAGSAAALLTFIGHIATKESSTITISAFAVPLFCFVCGMIVVVLATGTVYAAQASYNLERKKRGDMFNDISIICVLLSYLAFSTGAFFCVRLFSKAETLNVVNVVAVTNKPTASVVLTNFNPNQTPTNKSSN